MKKEVFEDKIAGKAENLSLVGMADYLNESQQFTKRTDALFTVSDVQGYCDRGYLPQHMGYNEIRLNTYGKTKVYDILNMEYDG